MNLKFLCNLTPSNTASGFEHWWSFLFILRSRFDAIRSETRNIVYRATQNAVYRAAMEEAVCDRAESSDKPAFVSGQQPAAWDTVMRMVATNTANESWTPHEIFDLRGSCSSRRPIHKLPLYLLSFFYSLIFFWAGKEDSSVSQATMCFVLCLVKILFLSHFSRSYRVSFRISVPRCQSSYVSKRCDILRSGGWGSAARGRHIFFWILLLLVLGARNVWLLEPTLCMLADTIYRLSVYRTWPLVFYSGGM